MLHILFITLFIRIVNSSEPDLITALSEQSSLSIFTSLARNYSTLLAAAKAGGITVLAPTDTAFETFFSSSNSATNFSTPDELKTLLSYHVLQGVHTQTSITSSPQFFRSLLTNSSYTNVTEGQFVKAVSHGDAVEFGSAVNTISNLVGPQVDIVFLGGVIHSVDKVLIPPPNFFQTVTQAPLPYYIQLVGQAILNERYSQLLDNLSNQADMTYFIANDPSAVQAAQQSNTSEQDVLTLINYAVIPGQVIFSSSLTNQSSFRTRANINLTITILNGSTYVDDAKITEMDILVANGVVHVTDKLLNPLDANSRPHINITIPSSPPVSPTPSTFSSKSLSTGAKAGIGVGSAIGALILLGGLVAIFKIRQSVNSRGPTATAETTKDRQELETNEKIAELDAPMSENSEGQTNRDAK